MLGDNNKFAQNPIISYLIQNSKGIYNMYNLYKIEGIADVIL